MDEAILGAHLAGVNTRRMRKAIALWPEAQVQRCAWHKWRNLVEHCPVHARRELKRGYDAAIYANDGLAARVVDARSFRGNGCASEVVIG